MAALVCLLHTAIAAWAQDVATYISAAPPPDWVEVATIDRSPFEQAGRASTQYLLIDRQSYLNGPETTRYRHYAFRMTTAEAVEEMSDFSVSFDPAFETVVLHSIGVWRDGKRRDLLDLNQLTLFRSETDRERLIYNGMLEMSYLLPDIRVGDIIEYSSSIRGSNPALGDHFTTRPQHEFPAAVRFLRNRIMVPEGSPVHFLPYLDAPEPKQIDAGGFSIFDWTARDVAKVELDDDIPTGEIVLAQTSASSFADWREVGAHFAPHYAVPDVISPEISQVAAEIAATHDSQEAQARAALDFVQTNIRYLGIELGEGGLIPRHPDLTLSRRFGDCKDMVVLLNALLSELGIDAKPLLVSLDLLQRVTEFIPSHSAFDHVITMMELDSGTFFVDPTRGVQLGDLHHLAITDFGHGVVIAPDGAGMIELPSKAPEYFEVFKDRFEPVAEGDDLEFHNISEYFGVHADQIYARVQSFGIEQLETDWLEFYQRQWPGIEQLSPMEMELNKAEARIQFSTRYKIADGWAPSDEGTHEFTAVANDLISVVPELPTGKRAQSWTFPHPVRVRQDIAIVLDDTWYLEAERVRDWMPSFRYSRDATFKGDVYELSQSYVSVSDQIAADEFPEVRETLERIRDNAGFTLWDDRSFLSSISQETITQIVVAYMVAAGLISVVGAYLTRNWDRDWRGKQVLYPVSLTKFIVLNLVTIGFYYSYWAYKNWVWIKEVEQQDMSPFWRAVFSGITNFALFPRMAKLSDQRPNWLKILAFPFALLMFLGNALDRYLGRADTADLWLYWLSSAAILLPVPVALHVLRLNKGAGKYVAMNSRFSWPVILMIVLWLPVFASLVVGNVIE